MLILGLDPGLTRCGVGLVSVGPDRAMKFHSVSVLRSPVEAELPARLKQIADELEVILQSNLPSAIALERVFAQQNVSTVMGTAQVSGVVMYLAEKYSVPVTLYTPSEVKAGVTGYGAADKKQVTAMVTKLLNLDAPPKPADAADALALAITHAWRQGRRAPNSIASARASTPAQVAWLAAEQQRSSR